MSLSYAREKTSQAVYILATTADYQIAMRSAFLEILPVMIDKDKMPIEVREQFDEIMAGLTKKGEAHYVDSEGLPAGRTGAYDNTNKALRKKTYEKYAKMICNLDFLLQHCET